MEYIPGDNLLKMFSNKNYKDFGERDISEIITVLLKTVQFLHNNNIVHRDLRPGNILFSVAGKYTSLKLIDLYNSPNNINITNQQSSKRVTVNQGQPKSSQFASQNNSKRFHTTTPYH